MKHSGSKRLLGGFILLLLLSACGAGVGGIGSGTGAGSAVPSGAAASDTAKEEAGTGMRSFIDATGVAQDIPANPRRIVTTQYLDALLALGVKPVGAGSWVMDANYQKGKIDGVADLGNPVAFEKILEFDPDLILVTEGEKPEAMGQFRKIAPTVVVPFVGGDVYKQVRDVAAVLNMEKKAEQWIAGLEAKAAEMKGKLKGQFKPDDTFTLYWVYGKDNLRVFGARNLGHVFYRMLGLNPPEMIRSKIAQDPDYNNFVSETISMETLPEYSGDYIVMCIYDQEARNGMFKQLQESLLWNNLPAVKNGHVIYVDADPWATYSPLAIQSQLEQVSDLLLAK